MIQLCKFKNSDQFQGEIRMERKDLVNFEIKKLSSSQKCLFDLNLSKIVFLSVDCKTSKRFQKVDKFSRKIIKSMFILIHYRKLKIH